MSNKVTYTFNDKVYKEENGRGSKDDNSVLLNWLLKVDSAKAKEKLIPKEYVIEIREANSMTIYDIIELKTNNIDSLKEIAENHIKEITEKCVYSKFIWIAKENVIEVKLVDVAMGSFG